MPLELSSSRGAELPTEACQVFTSPVLLSPTTRSAATPIGAQRRLLALALYRSAQYKTAVSAGRQIGAGQQLREGAGLLLGAHLVRMIAAVVGACTGRRKAAWGWARSMEGGVVLALVSGRGEGGREYAGATLIRP